MQTRDHVTFIVDHLEKQSTFNLVLGKVVLVRHSMLLYINIPPDIDMGLYISDK